MEHRDIAHPAVHRPAEDNPVPGVIFRIRTFGHDVDTQVRHPDFSQHRAGVVTANRAFRQRTVEMIEDRRIDCDFIPVDGCDAAQVANVKIACALVPGLV